MRCLVIEDEADTARYVCNGLREAGHTATLVRDGGADPFSGALYVFRSKRADRIKAVWWDGSGVCLFAKTLEETQFCWPKIAPTRVQLNHAQLLALIDGLDWTKVRPVVVKRPQTVG